MISTGDFKRGSRILVDGEPFSIESITVQTPSARGAATLVRCKLRNIVTGALLERTFKGGERFEVPDVSLRKVQFLYDDGGSCHFMETENYEQFALGNDAIDDARPWFAEEMKLDAVFWNGRIVGVTLPVHVEAQVGMVGGGARSDTAGGKNLKEATLTNGITIKVPLFVENGEKILVDPSTRDFVRRLLVLALLLVGGLLPVWGQDTPRAERLTIAFWPEYDRPAVLVTYRVELAPTVALPALVDLTIPADVGMPHAVAKRGADGGLYLTQSTREVNGEWAVMRVVTDRPQIHLEYYAPFAVSNGVRTFTYRWRGGMEIDSLEYEVLPPVSAVNVTVTPPPSEERMSEVGVPLLIGRLGAHAAAKQATIAITYSNPGGRLTVTPAPSAPTVSPPPLVSSSDQLVSSGDQRPAAKNRTLWFAIIVLGIATVILAGLWFARSNRGKA